MQPDPAPTFAPGEREELVALTHILFEALSSPIAELVLRTCMRSRWPHLTREHLLHVLQLALEQSRWRQPSS
jgi:hypothetical protein